MEADTLLKLVAGLIDPPAFMPSSTDSVDTYSQGRALHKARQVVDLIDEVRRRNQHD